MNLLSTNNLAFAKLFAYIKLREYFSNCGYMPKYCKECCLQGHDEESCWNIHPKLHEKELEKKEEANNKHLEERNIEHREGTNTNKGKEENTNKPQCLTRWNKYKRDRYGHIVGEVEEKTNDEVVVSNAFEALSKEVTDNNIGEKKEGQNTKKKE